MNRPVRRFSRCVRLMACACVVTCLGAVAASPASAAPKKKAKKDAAPAAAVAPEAPPPRPAPAAEPAPVVTERPGVVAPLPVPPPVPRHAGSAPAGDDAEGSAPRHAKKARWDGFFVSFNLGYAGAGGKDGPIIPPLQQGSTPPPPDTPDTSSLKASSPTRYNRAVTTNRGSGAALALQIGYNILGYASIWADLSWHGTFGSTVDMAGAGTAAALVGFHPLRFVRDGQLPVDVKLYGGYGFFDINYYYEAEMQVDAKGKAWTGTSLPFGVQTEFRLSEHFAIGLDLRLVKASYDKWIYNNDKDIASHLSAPETTLRFEPRVSFAGHF